MLGTFTNDITEKIVSILNVQEFSKLNKKPELWRGAGEYLRTNRHYLGEHKQKAESTWE